jgi:hypothetical protein
MMQKKSRLTEATVSPANEVTKERQIYLNFANHSQKNSKNLLKIPFDEEHSFLIHEACEGISRSFETLSKITETRENPHVRRTMSRIISEIHFFVGDLLQERNNLYQDNARLKQENTRHKAVIKSMHAATGADPDLHAAELRLKAIVTTQLENLKKKHLL